MEFIKDTSALLLPDVIVALLSLDPVVDAPVH